jgi:galactonate dehydratase
LLPASGFWLLSYVIFEAPNQEANRMARSRINRRSFSRRLIGSGALVASLDNEWTAEASDAAQVGPKDSIKITKLDTYVLKNSWVFVKISTDAGITGWGEMLKDKSLTCAAGAKQVAPYLIGQDPTRVVHHWQAIYRHAFYRGGPILTSVLSGIDQALWDIKGKALGLPVYQLLGGPTRDRIRVYGSREDVAKNGTSAFKTQVRVDDRIPYKHVEGAGYVQRAAESFAALRKEVGPNVDIGVEFHGAVQPQTALLIIKALEPYHPFFYEEPVQSQHLDAMADIAQKTHIPIATGERVYTKWGFRDVLEKKAASILQPDVCYAGGITELRLIAGMAEAYYVPIAPHNPQGPCSLAASLQIAASIPNFLIQERGTDTHADLLKVPFKQEKGYLPLPTGPGLGIEIDEDKLMAQVGEPRAYPITFDRDDGSVVDW